MELALAILGACGIWLAWQGLAGGEDAPRAPGHEALAARFAARLRRTGIALSPREFAGVSAAAGVGAALAAQAILAWPVLALVAGAGGLAAPYLFFLQRDARRRAAVEGAIVEAVSLLRQLIDAGQSVPGGLRLLGTLGPEPLRASVARLVADTGTLGQEAALARWREELAHPLSDRVAAALILVQRHGGAQLTAVLAQLVEATQADYRIRRQIRALQTQAVWQARLIAALPAVLLVTLRGVNPASMAIFDTPGGQLVLVGCALLEGTGYLWMLRAAAVRREERLFAGDAPGGGR